MKKLLVLIPLFCNAMQVDDLYTKKTAEAYHNNCKVQQYCTRKLLRSMIAAKMIGQNDAILDVGCGPGNITDFMAEKLKGSVVGIDSSPAMIECAKKHYGRDNLDFKWADIRYFKPTDRFDVVTVLNVMHQVDEVESIFAAIKKNCLKINGLLVLVLPPPQKQEEVDLLVKCFEVKETEQTGWELIHCTSKKDSYLYPDLQQLIDIYKSSIEWPANEVEENELTGFMQEYTNASKHFETFETGAIIGRVNWFEMIAKKIKKE